MRAILACAVLLAALPAAAAAPLCRDSKGLFTPCPPGVVRAQAERRAKVAREKAAVETADAAPDGKPQRVKPERPARPPAVARARLCRDGKGLFTPCPR